MKNLRAKMIFIVFLSAAAIFALTFMLVRTGLVIYQNRQADGMTLLISSYNGEVPDVDEYDEEDFTEAAPGYNVSISEESEFSTRYFVVMLNSDLYAVSANLEHVAAVDEEKAYSMAEETISGKRLTGYYTSYRYRIVANEGGTYSVIFLDCEEMLDIREKVRDITGIVSIAFPLMITLIFGFLSKRVMRPFEENTRSQKQFITDASHELKTPLAVISANASVLEYKLGENQWLKNITDQTTRMSSMIDDLLTLARMEEAEGKPEFEPVDLSEIVSSRINSFSEVFSQKNASVEADIASGIVLNGSAKQLSMLVSILTENASKYVTENGNVKISLTANSKYAVFRTWNTADLADDLDTDKLFNRFYRPDSSRNSGTGGQGIGLSTAMKIVQLHAGKISAVRENGGISFTAEISMRLK